MGPSVILAAVIGAHALLSPAARRASPTSLSFTEDNTPARSIRSSRVTVVSHAHGVKPGRGNAPQHAFEGQPFRGSYSHFNAQAADVDARRHDDLHRLKPG